MEDVKSQLLACQYAPERMMAALLSVFSMLLTYMLNSFVYLVCWVWSQGLSAMYPWASLELNFKQSLNSLQLFLKNILFSLY